MGIIERWNKFALKKIHINERIEISAGRLVFGIIMFLLAEFTTFELSWVFILFGVKIHRKNNNTKGGEDSDNSEHNS